MTKTILFDLDGTLVDTAPDLAAALNTTLKYFDAPAADLMLMREMISEGSSGIICKAFNIDRDHPRYSAYIGKFLNSYLANNCVHSQLFAGIPELLDHLAEQNIEWAIVTNKKKSYTQGILKKYPVLKKAKSIVYGDSTPTPKPHPAPVLLAMQQSKFDPINSIFIGDAEKDITAGRLAGVFTVLAQYGYVPPGVDWQNIKADAMITHPMEVLNWI